MKHIKLFPVLLLTHIVLIAITITASIYIAFIGESQWLIAVLTIPTINLLLLPITYKDVSFDPTHPIFMILVSLLIGTVLRSFFILSDLQSTNKHLMLLDKNPQVLLKGLGCIYLGLLFFVLGYSISKKGLIRMEQLPIFKTDINLKKFYVVGMAITCVSIIAAIYTFKKLGVDFSSIESISKKRFLKVGEDSYSALGYENLAMNLILPVYYMLVMYMLIARERFWSWLGLFVFFLGFLNILYPFIQSSRTSALYVFINTSLIIYFVKGGIKWSRILGAVSAAILILMVMTYFRYQSNKVVNRPTDEENPIVVMVGSLNFLGIDKTSQIVDEVPRRMQYQLGSTLILWMVAPIPRTLWLEKPEISIGRVIADNIYQKRDETTAGGGVPPGFIGELYLNFSYWGVIAGMFLFGYLLKLFYDFFVSIRSKSIFGMVVYLLAFLPFSINLIGGDLSRMIVNLLSTVIPVYIIIWSTKSKSIQNRPNE
jgi:oligosaccharide repeat unit polymerase